MEHIIKQVVIDFKKIVLYISLVFFVCCKKQKVVNCNSNIINELYSIIDSYIEKEPLSYLKITNVNDKTEYKSSKPSYHIFFSKNKNDSIIKLIKVPHYSPFYPSFINKSDKVNFTGFFYYKKKYPIFLFDFETLNIENCFSEIKDFTKIPDEYLSKGQISHIKSNVKTYKLSVDSRDAPRSPKSE